MDGTLHDAAIALLRIRLSVAFETTPLVDVEQRTREFGGRQRFVKSLGPQGVGVKLLKRFALHFVGGKEAMLDECTHHARLALEQAIATAAHGAGVSARCRERSANLSLCGRLTPIGENPRSRLDDCNRVVLNVEPDHRPTQRGRSEIKREPVRHFVRHDKAPLSLPMNASA